MAVVFAFDRFRSYVVLSKTIVHTDHSALRHLFKKQDAKPYLIRWILLLQEFDIEIKNRKGTENVAADHLSRIENDETSVDSEVDDNFPKETLMEINTKDKPWFVDFANYLVSDIIPKGMTYQQKKKFFSDLKHYFWEEPYLFKLKEFDLLKWDQQVVLELVKKNLFLLKDIDQDSAHMVVASKVPMLKSGEYEIWRMRIEQYIQMIDYALWEVIENGATLPKTKIMEGVMTVMPITTTEEKAQRRLEVKARITLMMGLPNEHHFSLPPPPLTLFETYLCELCGNNAHYGYDCSPQFPFVYEQEPKVQKKEQAYEEEKYSAACRYMLSITCDDEDDSIPLGVRWFKLAHIAPIPPGIVEANFDPNDDTLSDDDDFEDVEVRCFRGGSLDDKILVPEPVSSPRCARCGTPVDGPSCRGCAFLRKKFDEDLLAYCVENGIFKDFQDTSESSDDNTNVVNALQEPCVVNQDPDVKSLQDPPQIDHNCCYECGDSLDGIFCQQCICKFCGKGAHYGYNCPPKVPIISNPEQCNQTINELPQILPNENSFIYNSKPYSFNVSPSVLTYPPQLQFETYLCELCGNNAHYGYDCSPQFPFVYEQEPGPYETFQCQPMNEDYCEKNSCYYPNSFGFDHPQPPQDFVDHQGILQVLNKMEEKLEEIIRDRRKKIEDMSIEEMMHEQQLVDREIKEIINDLGYKRFRGEEIDEEYKRDCEIRIRKLKQDFNEWGSKDDSIPLGDIIARYSTSKAITPDLPIEEPDNSLNMGDEHLDTISAMKSDEVIKSSIENLVPIPSEFEADFDPNDDTLSDDDDFKDVEYVSLEEKLLNVHRLITNIKSLKNNPIPDCVLESPSPFPIPVVDSDSIFEESDTSLSHLDNSLSEFETSSDHTEETRSGSTTTHANYSLPEYDSFLF
ncbi:gypsy type transposase [Tanacetum coccineum]